MTHVAAAALALAVFAIIPTLLSTRRLRQASPRLLAVGHLVSLVGWSLLPAGWLACAGLGLAGILTRSASGPAACRLGESWFGIDAGPWQLAGIGLVLVALSPLAWQGARALSFARRTEPRGLALAGATQCRLSGGGSVWIVPAAEPLAYAGGMLHPRAVVTTGLLNLLDPAERHAVLEHEGAHVRLGHPRLLLLAAPVARAYQFLPPVRRAWNGLRQELEAAADAEAARLVGTAPLLSALARIGLARVAATGSGSAASFGDPEHLRYRIRRLQQPRQPAPAAGVVVVALGIVLAAAFAWCACALITPHAVLPSLAVCVGTFAAVGSRPLWTLRS
ncbi:M56 family metallopeptidase [Actinocrispum wychmicini]|uniref:Peptidase M48-like protein n=1 Tax=Actinocrispum wychmicini TaxID=1213861 RepID=A0A4R2JQ40_9PSEU|nr:M56 family metallopeptidase [Actinocrispum wychmicini]TCO59288.1 peptidase M48-like protein [Actinocrispum wychmicini]